MAIDDYRPPNQEEKLLYGVVARLSEPASLTFGVPALGCAHAVRDAITSANTRE